MTEQEIKNLKEQIRSAKTEYNRLAKSWSNAVKAGRWEKTYDLQTLTGCAARKLIRLENQLPGAIQKAVI